LLSINESTPGKKQTIEDYVVDNARSKTSFNNWLSIINSANWNEPKDMTTHSAMRISWEMDRNELFLISEGTITG
jgi:mRNA-degrading endonuclease HigB of HigAB toxin-antitoxin module